MIEVQVKGTSFIFNNSKDAAAAFALFSEKCAGTVYGWGKDNRVLAPLDEVTMTSIKYKCVDPCAKCGGAYDVPGEDGLCEKCREGDDDEQE